MNVPINWLKKYVTLPKSVDLLADRLTMIGHMLDKIDRTPDNVVMDLELRGNRADCYSIYGIAREVAAIHGTRARMPKLAKGLKKVKQLSSVKMSVKSKNVKRVMMVAIRNVEIKDSPRWLKDALKLYGVEPINNIVDLTNYVAIELGEPMHAFDLDKIGKDLCIRMAKNGEKMTTFQDTTLTLHEEDLVWASTNAVLSVAGAIGEKHHSISSKTKNILLEAANYDRANIRRSVHRHSLFTEAGIRHEKELDPNLVSDGIYRFLYLLKQNKWGKVVHEIYDYYPNPVKQRSVKLVYKELSDISGFEIKKDQVKKIFRSLGFSLGKSDASSVTVNIPTFRTDVENAEDLIEEVLRIYGYDKIPQRLLSFEIPPDITPKYITQENDIKSALSGIGFLESINLPFVKEKFQNLNDHPTKNVKRVSLLNAPSLDTKFMRTNMLVNLYENAKKVINERGDGVQIFEVGKIYYKDSSGYPEERRLGMVYWAKGATYLDFKTFLMKFFVKINLSSLNFTPEALRIDGSETYEIFIGKKAIGYGGKFDEVYFAEVYLDEVLPLQGKTGVKMMPKYPAQIEDVTIDLPEKTFIGEVKKDIKAHTNVVRVLLVNTFKRSFTFRVWYQSSSKTLTDKEVEAIRNKIVGSIEKKFGGVVRN